MLVKLKRALGYNGDVLEKDAIVQLPLELAQSIINCGNADECINDSTGDDSDTFDNGTDAKKREPRNAALGRSARNLTNRYDEKENKENG